MLHPCPRLESQGTLKGATLLAAASHVSQAFPDSKVCAFALLRTMGFVESVEQILDACTGTISWDGTDVIRVP